MTMATKTSRLLKKHNPPQMWTCYSSPLLFQSSIYSYIFHPSWRNKEPSGLCKYTSAPELPSHLRPSPLAIHSFLAPRTYTVHFLSIRIELSSRCFRSTLVPSFDLINNMIPQQTPRSMYYAAHRSGSNPPLTAERCDLPLRLFAQIIIIPRCNLLFFCTLYT